VPDELTRQAIVAHLTTRTIGRCLEVYPELDSTNTRAVALGRLGAPDGTVVVADVQTAGRGRLGRRWLAPVGSALLFSILFRPELQPSQAQRIAMICSLAALEAVYDVSGVAAQVKWPNDLVVAGRKLGGMLTELGLTPDGRLSHVVVGMGLNVNLDPAALPEVMTPPTSVLAETGHTISRAALLAALLAGVEQRYERLRSGWSPHEEWRGRLATRGQAVQVGTPDEVIVGVAADVDADGALLVQTPNGDLRRVLVGDVTLRGERPSGPTG
jgi:BirA family biotin operon repressor/biotin-[acetyl-CoA-carboxylase] ligase